MNNYGRTNQNPYMSQNNLTSGFANFNNTNIPFSNNTMLSNNPMLMGSIRDPEFCKRLQMAKIEQFKKIKSVNELNMTKDQLVKYVINPIIVEKMDQATAKELYSKIDSEYDHFDKKIVLKNYKFTPISTSSVINDWWSSRSNMPYKNILKQENYKKEIKSKDDLIVHKYTALDRDKIILESELDKKLASLEKHSNELKMIYSASNHAKCKEEFKYVQKYKYRIKYDPKNFDDLKKAYKKEQKKLIKDTKRIDELIEAFLDDDATEEDYAKFKELQKQDKKYDDHELEDPTDQIIKNTKEELKKTMTKEEYDEFMSILNDDDNDDNKIENTRDNHVESESSKKKKVKITRKNVKSKSLSRDLSKDLLAKSNKKTTDNNSDTDSDIPIKVKKINKKSEKVNDKKNKNKSNSKSKSKSKSNSKSKTPIKKVVKISRKNK